jgi:hypothetical protein
MVQELTISLLVPKVLSTKIGSLLPYFLAEASMDEVIKPRMKGCSSFGPFAFACFGAGVVDDGGCIDG